LEIYSPAFADRASRLPRPALPVRAHASFATNGNPPNGGIMSPKIAFRDINDRATTSEQREGRKENNLAALAPLRDELATQ
jgi:hypothetical protein